MISFEKITKRIKEVKKGANRAMHPTF